MRAGLGGGAQWTKLPHMVDPIFVHSVFICMHTIWKFSTRPHLTLRMVALIAHLTFLRGHAEVTSHSPCRKLNLTIMPHRAQCSLCPFSLEILPHSIQSYRLVTLDPVPSPPYRFYHQALGISSCVLLSGSSCSLLYQPLRSPTCHPSSLYCFHNSLD